MARYESPTWMSYAAAVSAVAAASVFSALLMPLVGLNILFVAYMIAVIFTAWYGGVRPALFTTVVGYLVANLVFLEGEDRFHLNLAVAAYFLGCSAIAFLSETTRRARRLAEASAQQVVSLVENISDGFIALDSQWNCTYRNRAAEVLARGNRHSEGADLGLGDAGTGRSLAEVFPLAALESVIPQLRQAADANETVEFECFHPDWRKWFEIKASPAIDGTLAVFFRDITERKVNQMALAQSEERLRLAQQGARAGLWDWDMATNVVTWSDEYYEINGLDRGTCPSMEHFWSHLYGEDRARVEQSIQKALAERGRIDIQYRIEHPSRGLRWIAARWQTTYADDGSPLRTSGIVLDITERKRAEESLGFLSEAGNVLSVLVDFESTVQSVARLAVQFVADYCVVHTVTPLGTIEHLAHAHRDVAKEPMLKRSIEQHPLRWESRSPVVHVLKTRTPVVVTDVTPEMLDALAADEEHRRTIDALGPVSWMVVPLAMRDKSIGTITFVSAESRRRYDEVDLALVTELARRLAAAADNVRLYTELRESQRQKDDFLAMLAHELRNPLAAIQYANQLAQLTKHEDNPASEVIDRQVRNLAHLIDDLLEVSRITRDKIQLRKEVVDASELLGRALSTVKPSIESRRHKLIVECSQEPMPLLADPVRVEQILVNLLSNAAKYTSEEGQIGVRVFGLSGHAVFKIRDTGIGIPPEMLPRVFELFTQVDRSLDRSQGGLGIGLTVVRRLAEMHGGSVSVTSEGVGRGSEFTVRLPLTSSPQALSEQPRAATACGPMKILVVDDNVDMAQSLGMLLRQAGHTISTAHDGPAALEAARSFVPDVILLDIGLPGLDGYRVAETLRREPAFSKVRLVAVSGYGQAEDRRRTKDAGFDHHLVKPVDFRELESAIAGD